jgi:hypothetical protein
MRSRFPSIVAICAGGFVAVPPAVVSGWQMLGWQSVGLAGLLLGLARIANRGNPVWPTIRRRWLSRR